MISVSVINVATHPEDDLVLAIAVSAVADYLVTGRRGLQAVGRYRAVTILSPGAVLTLLNRHHPSTP